MTTAPDTGFILLSEERNKLYNKWTVLTMATTLIIKPFGAAEYLDTDEPVAVFLADALDSGDALCFRKHYRPRPERAECQR